VAAATLNPVDLTIAAGVHPHLATPSLPYVPGREAVGTIVEGPAALLGKRVYAAVRGAGGMLAEQALAPVEDVVEIPAGIADESAAALGIAGTTAWLALRSRAALSAGETVLVLGASGAVGALAVQIAAGLGAGRVVAAARSAGGLRRAREYGAHAVVDLRDDGSLPERLLHACEGGADVIIDPLWGAPAAAALRAARRGARLVVVGTSAGTTAMLDASVRERSLEVLGHPVPPAHREQEPLLRREAYRELLGWLAEGRLAIDTQRLELEDIGEAWRRQAGSPGRKLVISP